MNPYENTEPFERTKEEHLDPRSRVGVITHDPVSPLGRIQDGLPLSSSRHYKSAENPIVPSRTVSTDRRGSKRKNVNAMWQFNQGDNYAN